MSITRYKYPSETLVQAACRLYGILRLHGLVGVDSTLLIGRRCDDDGTLSADLRRRLVRAVEAGSSAREAARRFEVCASAAIKLAR
ncbi:hypothetical protein ACFQU2_37940 [Siccirubricoccus deserti]